MSGETQLTEQREADGSGRPLALVTGAGRSAGIAASVVLDLVREGWDAAFTYWTPYDERMRWGVDPGAPEELRKQAESLGARTRAIEADLSDPGVPARLFDRVERELGNVTALVLCHCESVDSGLLDPPWKASTCISRSMRGPPGC